MGAASARMRWTAIAVAIGATAATFAGCGSSSSANPNDAMPTGTVPTNLGKFLTTPTSPGDLLPPPSARPATTPAAPVTQYVTQTDLQTAILGKVRAQFASRGSIWTVTGVSCTGPMNTAGPVEYWSCTVAIRDALGPSTDGLAISAYSDGSWQATSSS